LRSSERQALVGPPESMREHVVAGSKAMRNGDWKKCRDLIINDKMNGKVIKKRLYFYFLNIMSEHII
jgi:translation initiation factor 3 subunit C